MGLLQLVMIVKDEARSIAQTIASVRPWIDRAVVVDTGSTDGTPDLAAAALDGLPSVVHHAAFVDFATTRNLALALAGEAATFTLMLSGDETLRGGPELRAFCAAHAAGGDGAYYLAVEFGTDVFDSARLARASAGWRYVGAVHEVLCHPTAPAPAVRVPGARVFHDLAGRAPPGRARWERDRALLEAQQDRDPRDPRTAFYLAQTYECLGEHGRAADMYVYRAGLPGWDEETYEALYRAGRATAAAGRPWAEALRLYLDAHAARPHRAEPLVRLAEHYAAEGVPALVELFGRAAAARPFPARDRLFVNRDDYGPRVHALLARGAAGGGRW